MDTYGNGAYKMIFGFLMVTAVIGIIMAKLMKLRIKKMSVSEK